MLLLLLACADLDAPPVLPPPPALDPPARGVPAAPLQPEAWVDGLDGLRCADLAAGTGPIAAAEGAVVTVEYTAWADDGAVWDSTWSREGPHRFQVGGGRMIEGIDRGVRGLRAGAVRQLAIPAVLGFGDYGMPERVAPGTDLVVDVEVLDVQVPPNAPADVAYSPRGGLELAELAEGEGRAIAPGDTAVVDWVVWDPDGAVLDTSWSRAAPYRLRVDGLRLGPALLGMRPGGRRQVRVAPGSVFAESGVQPALPSDRPVVVQVAVHAVE